MPRRRWSRCLVGMTAVSAVLALGGCEGRSADPSPASPSSSTTPGDVTAADVTGLWSAGRSGSRLPVEVELGADGRVSGSDGCNSFSGRRWSLDGDRVQLRGAQLTSLVACPSYSTWLDRAASFRLRDGRLVADEPGRLA